MLGCLARPSLCLLPTHTNLLTKVDLVMSGKSGMLNSFSCYKMTRLHRSVSTTSADVVISGGGMVGTAAAATIAKLGR